MLIEHVMFQRAPICGSVRGPGEPGAPGLPPPEVTPRQPLRVPQLHPPPPDTADTAAQASARQTGGLPGPLSECSPLQPLR